MRGLALLAGLGLTIAGLVMMSGPACKRRAAKVETIETTSDGLSTAVHMGNPNEAIHLVKGFYDIEQGAWRWTRSQFAITLLAPKNAAERGATLEFKLTLPEAVFSRTGPVTLSAVIDGYALPPLTMDKVGNHVYEREIPASAFRTETATVEFSLDKFLASGVVEERELGVIALSAALLAK
jgi:hypothetical protein